MRAIGIAVAHGVPACHLGWVRKPAHEHSSRDFETELRELRAHLLAMGARCERIVGLAFAGLWLVDRIGRRWIARRHRRFGFGELSDPASLPLFVLTLSLLWLAVLPAFHWEARRIEGEADRFALELTHRNRAAAELFAGWANHGLAQTRYKLGLSSIVELSQAQLQQTEAEITHTNAQYQYRLTLAALKFQTGEQP